MKIEELLNKIPNANDPEFQKRFPKTEFLFSFADRLMSIKPENVLLVVALPPRPSRSERHWLHLVTISRRFSTEYSTIELMAKHLAPTVLQTGIVPIVEPLAEHDLAAMLPDFPPIRFMFDRGSLIYRGFDDKA